MACGFKSPKPDSSKRGKPRAQYERTYVLLPQGAGKEWAQVVVDTLWDTTRPTIGSSADDAGVGDLDVRNIILVNPDGWGSEDAIRAWYEDWYPGVNITAIVAGTPEELREKLSPSPTPAPIPVSDFPIAGVHDLPGGEWMVANKVKGWCVIPVYLGTSPRAMPELQRLTDAGVRVILNLRYSYAVDDGGQGTMPGPDKLEAFIEACLGTIQSNLNVWGFVLCNEMNNTREHPEGFTLTPDYYANFYNDVFKSIPVDAKTRLSPGAIDPYNPGWRSWQESWAWVLQHIQGADFLSFHAYTHGHSPTLIRSNTKFGHDPLQGVYYDMRVLESQQAIIPECLQSLPQLVTETNPDADGLHGWPDDGAWVKEAYSYFRERGIVGAMLFRYNYDKWHFGDKAQVLEALIEESKR